MATFYEVDGREGGGYLSRNVNIPSKVFVLVPLEGKGTGGPGLLEGGAAVWVGIIAVNS